MTIQEMIDVLDVLEAAKAGKKIQFSRDQGQNWHDCQWDEITVQYRVNPEPREFWLCNGFDKRTWIVVDAGHSGTCPGETIKVREVLD